MQHKKKRKEKGSYLKAFSPIVRALSNVLKAANKRLLLCCCWCSVDYVGSAQQCGAQVCCD
jgi:hypothetical protein